jgi:hypothetical protein
MLDGKVNAERTVKILEEIVKRQIPVSDRMAELCESDPRLGYHSEAEVYKYFPEKLKWRSETLRQLLANDFPALRQALAEGKTASEVLEEKAVLKCGQRYEGANFRWQADLEERYLKFTVEIDDTGRSPVEDAVIIFVGDRLAAQRPWNTHITLAPHENVADALHRGCAQGKVERKGDKWEAVVRLPLALLPDSNCCRVGLERIFLTADGQNHYHHFPEGEYDHDVRLQFGSYTTDMMLTLEF